MTAIVELKNATKVVKNGFDEEKDYFKRCFLRNF